MTRVIIVGAGIGGIATALALRRDGIEHVVLEQAPRLAEVGAGIQLSPNGTQDPRLAGRLTGRWPPSPSSRRRTSSATGGPARRCSSCRSGRRCARPSRLPISTPTAPTCWRRCSTRWAIATCGSGAGLPRCGKTPAASRRCSKTAPIERGSILVGADGIHSLVRDRVFAPAAPLEANLDRAVAGDGYAAWRGLVPGETASALGIERRSYIWLGPGRSVVLYYVSAGRLLNWIGIGRSDEAKRESWSATGSVEALLADLRRVGTRRSWVSWPPPSDRSSPGSTIATPLASWVKGRVVLLGDAAHAMLPYHAQGAVQSLEDAWVLARSIAMAAPAGGSASTGQPGAIEEALLRYQTLRRDRATQVQAYSRAAQDWYHVSDPVEIARRDERFRAVARRGDAGFSSQQEWLYAYDAEKAALGEDDQWRAMRWR